MQSYDASVQPICIVKVFMHYSGLKCEHIVIYTVLFNPCHSLDKTAIVRLSDFHLEITLCQILFNIFLGLDNEVVVM